ncbi:MAG: hypothetical protein M1821_000804 [Bathelium mastoideum]|nr:MAG: hypothetical protein M1821_000804 [Bathelium mastoideum]
MEDQNNGYRTYIAIGFTIGITCVAIFLRLLARKVQKLALGWDDYTIVLGAILTVVTAGLWARGVESGFGRHLLTLSSTELVEYSKIDFIIYQTNGAALTLIKISILLFYVRIFDTRHFRPRVYIVGALVIAWFFANMFTALFQCNPIKKAWLPTLPYGHCINPLTYVKGVQTANITLDVIILALPVSGVWRLQMPISRKIGVAGIFLLGGLSVVIAIIRMTVILRANLEDITWYTSIASWTCVEPGVEVLSASLPAMAPFLRGRRFLSELGSSLRGMFSSSKRSKSNGDSGFRKFDEPSRLSDPERNPWGTSTAEVRHEVRDGASEIVPLHAIRVTDCVNIGRS